MSKIPHTPYKSSVYKTFSCIACFLVLAEIMKRESMPVSQQEALAFLYYHGDNSKLDPVSLKPSIRSAVEKIMEGDFFFNPTVLFIIYNT